MSDACTSRTRSISICRSCMRPRISCPRVSVRSSGSRLAPDASRAELEGVAQFLDREPHVVQTFGQIDRAGLVDRGAQSRRALGDTRVDRPAPPGLRGISAASRASAAASSCFASSSTSRSSFRAMRRNSSTGKWWNSRLRASSRASRWRRQPAQSVRCARGAKRAARQSEACRTSSSRTVPSRAVTRRSRRLSFTRGAVVELEDWQQLAKPPRRDARAMQRA